MMKSMSLVARTRPWTDAAKDPVNIRETPAASSAETTLTKTSASLIECPRKRAPVERQANDLAIDGRIAPIRVRSAKPYTGERSCEIAHVDCHAQSFCGSSPPERLRLHRGDLRTRVAQPPHDWNITSERYSPSLTSPRT